MSNINYIINFQGVPYGQYGSQTFKYTASLPVRAEMSWLSLTLSESRQKIIVLVRMAIQDILHTVNCYLIYMGVQMGLKVSFM